MRKKLDKIFKKSKSIPLDVFLEKVLYDKDFGYYQKRNPFGKRGDFITSPNISNIFCEMIAIWFVSFWQDLKKPKNINFVELGPGNGDLSFVFIETLKNFPEVFRSVNIFLYEKSINLIKVQKKRVLSNKVSWIKSLKNLKKGPIIFFGNEFLDALPIKQFKKIDNNIYEKHVQSKSNKIDFYYKKASKSQIKKLKNYKLFNKNGIIEYPEYGFKELDLMCEKINRQNGGLLFIDYGYKRENNQNTLQSVYKHKFNDITENIGNADITYLVNFELYKRYFISKNLHVENIISQSQFLQKMGIKERFRILSDKMDKKNKLNLYRRIQRLINPSMMGENFKVIFAKNKKSKFSLAFK